MKTIKINTEKPYDVIIGNRILSDAGNFIRNIAAPCPAAVVMDENVVALYGDTITESLEYAGYKPFRCVFPAGEENKNIRTLENLLAQFAENGLTRSDIVVAAGGGVTGDISGLAASLYLRGIRYVQMPTTLLAAVDSSVGGKTAIDFAGRKNIVGAFYQPSLVICDTDTFKTLSPEIYADGLAESIKYGVIWSEELFRLFEDSGNLDINNIVTRCVEIKGKIVVEDERDDGLRQILNFGHTPAHAVEALSGYKISHGFAVAMGMGIMARAARHAGICRDDTPDRLEKVLRKSGLPVTAPYGAKELSGAALADKKRKGDKITLVLPVRMGECTLYPIPVSELEKFFNLGIEEKV